MSRSVDERIVSMQFDNKHFEANAQTTISTLDKLKQKLNLSGSAKGLENVGAAAKQVDMSGLSNGIENVRSKFSAMEVIGVTALANITNSAVNAGKRLLSALTIEPITTGFNEYELKMDSVRTIMASTGESVDSVNGYLEELNEYSDQTIYSFADMTQNIGKFTNAGVKLEDAVLAIKGISNEAAVSGANANEASRAMYNFAQALSAGHVKLIDWKSIENANMATVEFKNQLLESAVAAGTLTKAGDGMYKTLKGKTLNATQNFNDTLQDQWMTSEVLIGTLKNYADTTTDIGKKAFAAATETTKFTQMLDVLKETAQSGWARTWEIIIGDIEQAKAIFTPLTEFFGGIIDGISDFRNKILESALGRGFSAFGLKLREIINAIDGVVGVAKGAVGAVRDFGDIVDRVINGDFNNGLPRVEALTKAGWNYYAVQNKVNEKLNNSFRYSEERIAQQDKLLGLQTSNNEALKDGAKAQKDNADAVANLTKEEQKRLAELVKMTDAELADLGLKPHQIKALRELERIAKQLGMPVEEFLEKLDQINGRWLMIEGFKNIGSSIAKSIKAIGNAWAEIFPPEESANKLFNFIAGFYKLSRSLIMSDESAENLKRTFKGVFAVLDIVLTIVGGPIKIAFKIFAKILSLCDLSILKLTAKIGDAIVKFRDWLDSVLNFDKVLEWLVPHLKNAYQATKNWFASFAKSEPVKKFLDYFSAIPEKFKAWIAALKESENLPKDIVDGLVRGFKNAGKAIWGVLKEFGKRIWNVFTPSDDTEGAASGTVSKIISILIKSVKIAGAVAKELGKRIWSGLTSLGDPESPARDVIRGIVNGLAKGATAVWNAAVGIAKKLWEGFCNFLGIASPAKKMIEGAQYAIQGIVIGIKNGAKAVWNAIKTVATGMVDIIKKIDFGAVFAAVLSSGIVYATVKMAAALTAIVAPFEGFGDFLEDVGVGVKRTLTGLGKSLKATAFKKQAQGILIYAIALGVLAAAIYMLAKIDTGKMWSAVGAMAALAAVVVLMSQAINKFGAAGKGKSAKQQEEVRNLVIAVLGISVAMLLLAKALSSLAKLSWGEMFKGATAITILGGIIVGLIAATKLFNKDATKIGGTLIKMAVAMLLLVFVVKQIAKLDPAVMAKGIAGMVLFGGVMTGLMAATKLFNGGAGNVGGALIKITIALGLMVFVVKLAASLDDATLSRGISAVVKLGILMTALMLATKLFKGEGNSVANTLLKLSIAIGVLALVVTMLGNLSLSACSQGVLAVGALSLIMTMLIKSIGKIKKPELAKVGTTLIMLSIAIGLMSASVMLMSFLRPENIAKGLIAVGLLAGLMTMMIKATAHAKDCKGSLMAMAIAIGIMVAGIAVLSFIDPKKLAVSAAALGGVMAAFAAMIAAMGQLKTGQKSFKRNLTTLISLVAVVALLGGILVAMSKLTNPQSLISVAGSLGILLTSMSVALAVIGNSKTMTKQKLTRSMTALAIMVPIIAMLGGILAGMSYLNVDSAISNATALSLMLLAMSGAMVILGTIKKAPMGAVGAMAVLALVVAELALILGAMAYFNVEASIKTVTALSIMLTVMAGVLVVLSLIGAFASLAFPAIGAMAVLGLVVAELAVILGLMAYFNVEASIKTVTALSIMLTVMAGVLVVLSAIGAFASLAFPAIGAMAVLGLVVAELAVILGLMAYFNVEPSIETAKALSTLLLAMSAALVILALVGATGPAAFIGIGALATLLTAMGGIMVGVGALMTKFPQLEAFLDKGIPVLEKVAFGIGSIMGNFAAGVASGVMKILPAFGAALGGFMMNAMPFVAGMKLIDEKVLAGVGILAAAIIALTAASLIDGILKFLPFVDSFAGLGTELSNFIKNAMPFIEGVKLIDETAAMGVKNLADAILAITAANLLENISSFIGGGSSLGDFGAQLGQLGTDLKTFVTNLGNFTPEQVTTVQCACDAIKALASAAKTLPNDGGWLGAIVGENSIGAFGAQLAQVGTDLKNFVTNLGVFTEDQVTTVDCAGRAIKALADAASEIPNDGGWLAVIVGDNSLATFGSKLPTLATNIKDFVTNLGTFSEEQVSTVDCAGRAITALADAANKIPNEGGFWSKIVGDNSLAAFGDNLPTLGSNIAKFVTNLGTFSTDQVATVNSAVDAIGAFAKLGDKDIKVKNISGIGKHLETLGTKLASFCSKINETGSDAIKTATSNLNTLISTIKNIASSDLDAAKSLGDSLKKIAETGVNDFVKAFTGKDATTDVTNAAKTMIDTFVSGLTDNATSVNTAATDVAKGAASAMSSETISTAAYNAGKAIASGFAGGISKNAYLSSNAASAMATAAINKAKQTLSINSPSKVFRAIGTSVPGGFAMGIGKLGTRIKDAAKGMANTAVSSVKNSISRLASLVSNDIDIQPTIRPVIDLSDVRSGASTIGDLLSGNRTLSVDVRGATLASASMARIQNGGDTNDVVAAIKSLRKDLAENPRNSYNINGITYDDGSNVASAIQTLIRAAKIERRA